MTSAFQIATTLGYLAAGWFLDRTVLRRGFALGVGLRSLAGRAHALAGAVTQFLLARAVLGAAKATGMPSLTVILPQYRGLGRILWSRWCRPAPRSGSSRAACDIALPHSVISRRYRGLCISGRVGAGTAPHYQAAQGDPRYRAAAIGDASGCIGVHRGAGARWESAEPLAAPAGRRRWLPSLASAWTCTPPSWTLAAAIPAGGRCAAAPAARHGVE
jgi:hypothetical protein